MKLPVRSLSALAMLVLGLSGCIVIPAHRYHAPPRGVVVIEGGHGHPGHRGRYEQRDDRRYDRYDDHGPYRR